MANFLFLNLLLSAKVVELPPDKRPLLSSNYYRPKLPLPRDCFNKIDAAFSFGTTLYLISNTFLWQYKMPEFQMIGPPQRVSNVLAGWHYTAKATFTGWFEVIRLFVHQHYTHTILISSIQQVTFVSIKWIMRR